LVVKWREIAVIEDRDAGLFDTPSEWNQCLMDCAAELEAALKEQVGQSEAGGEAVILFLAHSCTLRAEALELKAKLEVAGHTVQMPCDPEGHTEYGIHTWNAALIRQAEAVLALWDGISDGCYGDVSMAIALGKPLYVKYPVGMERPEYSRRTTEPTMRRAWSLFSELQTIEEFMERTPAATHGGE